MKNELLDTVLNELKEKKKKPCDCEMEESTQVGASEIRRQSNRAVSVVAAAKIKCNRHQEGSELHQQCMYDAMNKDVQETFKDVVHQSVSNRIMGKEELNEDIVELLRSVKDLHGLVATHIKNQQKKKDDEENGVNEQVATAKRKPILAADLMDLPDEAINQIKKQAPELLPGYKAPRPSFLDKPKTGMASASISDPNDPDFKSGQQYHQRLANVAAQRAALEKPLQDLKQRDPIAGAVAEELPLALATATGIGGVSRLLKATAPTVKRVVSKVDDALPRVVDPTNIHKGMDTVRKGLSDAGFAAARVAETAAAPVIKAGTKVASKLPGGVKTAVKQTVQSAKRDLKQTAKETKSGINILTGRKGGRNLAHRAAQIMYGGPQGIKSLGKRGTMYGTKSRKEIMDASRIASPGIPGMAKRFVGGFGSKQIQPMLVAGTAAEVGGLIGGAWKGKESGDYQLSLSGRAAQRLGTLPAKEQAAAAGADLAQRANDLRKFGIPGVITSLPGAKQALDAGWYGLKYAASGREPEKIDKNLTEPLGFELDRRRTYAPGSPKRRDWEAEREFRSIKTNRSDLPDYKDLPDEQKKALKDLLDQKRGG